jgi:hypothetical protein
LSGDGARLYFSSERSGAQLLYVSTRADAGSSFGAPTLVRGAPAAIAHPTLSPDELEMVFSAQLPGGVGGFDLWVVRRPDVGSPFGAPSNLTGLNTPDEEFDPALSRDGKAVHYVRGYNYQTPNGDIWTATRSCAGQ